MARPQRNNQISYVGRETFMVTAVTLHRAKAFGRNDFARIAIKQLLKQATQHRFELPAFTYMPDHAHVVATGIATTSDLRVFISAWKQATGFDWSQFAGGRLWQEGYWDRHLRAGGSVVEMIDYVVQNPVRAGLVDDAARYPWTGSTIYTMDEMISMIKFGGTKVPPSR